jgi:O-antigen ligase
LLLAFGLFLTFSRTAIAVFGVMTMIMFLFEFFKLRKLEYNEGRLQKSKNLIKLFVLVIISCLLVIVVLFPYLKARFFATSLEEQAVDLRFFYNKIALSMIEEKPISGIGIGNFVNYSQNYQTFLRAAIKVAGENVNQPPDWIFQPEHNIYLLIASEMGILGLLTFLAFIILNIWRSNPPTSPKLWRVRPLTILFFGFLIIGLADHYFWTLQAGGIMFWLALALAKTKMFPKEIK